MTHPVTNVHRRPVLWAVAAALLLVAGCADSPTPPASPDHVEPAAGLLSTTLTTLERTDPVEEGTCASGIAIGPAGGVVECEEAGLRLTFPEGAVSDTVEVSVDVPRGDLVGYEFAPHGIEFEKKVRLRQALDGTEAAGDLSLLGDLEGAYVDEVDDEVEPLEELELGLLGSGDEDDDPEAVFMDIEHFSGYVCASN